MKVIAEQYVSGHSLPELQVAAAYRKHGMTRVAQGLGPIGVGNQQLTRVAVDAQVPVHALGRDHRVGLNVWVQPRPPRKPAIQSPLY